jgi:RNA polymerase sigma factor (sigma-70 family)
MPTSAPVCQDDIVRIAYRHARQIGLSREDAQDCAMDFRLHLHNSSHSHPDNLAWLHRCAHNYACNYLRTQVRRSSRERNWVESSTGPLQRPTDVPQPPGPRTLTLRKQLWEQLIRLLHQYTPAQQELFVRYHLRRQSIPELSRRTGRTPHALRQSLSQMHHRLADQLHQQGWSGADAKRMFFR